MIMEMINFDYSAGCEYAYYELRWLYDGDHEVSAYPTINLPLPHSI